MATVNMSCTILAARPEPDRAHPYFRRWPIAECLHEHGKVSFHTMHSSGRDRFSIDSAPYLREEEKHMKPSTVEAGTTGLRPSIPLPWQTFNRFCRLIWDSCVVSFGPRPRQTNPYRIPHSTIAASAISQIGLPASRESLQITMVELSSPLSSRTIMRSPDPSWDGH
jgi:hypothetical protein